MSLGSAIIVLIIFLSLLTGLAIISWTVVRLAGAARGRSGNDDESRLIQEMYQGMQRMEQRVEALETLLLERDAARKAE